MKPTLSLMSSLKMTAELHMPSVLRLVTDELELTADLPRVTQTGTDCSAFAHKGCQISSAFAIAVCQTYCLCIRGIMQFAFRHNLAATAATVRMNHRDNGL